MEASGLSERVRRRLAQKLAADPSEPDRWVERVSAEGRSEGIPACAHALRSLFRLEREEVAARSLLARIARHRVAMTAALGRDPGLAVAGADYLANVEALLRRPAIVETESLEKTERTARTDSLTGLHNRAFFDESLEREIRRSRRYGLPASILLLDLDRFKEVNDRHGHLFGDLVLERFGVLLRGTARDADVVCRYGGEEFVVLLPETPRPGAWVAGERIRAAAETAFATTTVDGVRVPMTVSGGIGSWPEDGAHPREVLVRADAALYRAKRTGRNRIVAHHDEKRARTRFPARAGTRVPWRAGPSEAFRGAKVLEASEQGFLLDDPEAGLPEPGTAVELDFAGGIAATVVRRRETASAVRFAEPLPADLIRALRASNVSRPRKAGGVER